MRFPINDEDAIILLKQAADLNVDGVLPDLASHRGQSLKPGRI